VGWKVRSEGVHSLGCFIERDPQSPKRFRVSASREGKQSLSHFTILDRSKNASLLEFQLATGRTHQIRVHASFLGHPVFGDALYGGSTASRMMLHAHTLRFLHPLHQKAQVVRASLDDLFSQELASRQLKEATHLLDWKDSRS
jgi:23S rRNA pseudouridine1911/1915/1917 synthase